MDITQKSLVIEKFKLKSLIKEGISAAFYFNGRRIGESPDAVLKYISLHKRFTKDVSLEYMLRKQWIRTVESYELALEKWNTIKPITDEEYTELFGYSPVGMAA